MTTPAVRHGIETEFGRFDKSEEILEVQDRIHVDITLPVARRLIDEETRDIRHHLQQHLNHKKNGYFKEGQVAAQQAMQIVSRVTKIKHLSSKRETERSKRSDDRRCCMLKLFLLATPHQVSPHQTHT